MNVKVIKQGSIYKNFEGQLAHEYEGRFFGCYFCSDEIVRIGVVIYIAKWRLSCWIRRVK